MNVPGTSGYPYRGTVPIHVRNQAVVDAYLGGAPMAAVGAQFDITRERVRQILADAGVPSRTLSETNQLAYEAWVAEHGPALDAAFDERRSIQGVVAAHPGLRAAWVRRYLADRAHEQVLVRPPKQRRYRHDGLVAALRRAAVDGHLTMGRYQQVRQPGDPSTGTVINRFGSWAAAVEQAGLTPGRTWRTYERRWSDAELRDALAAYVEVCYARGERPTCRGYDAYRYDERDDLPSLSLIRVRINGSLSAIMNTP